MYVPASDELYFPIVTYMWHMLKYLYVWLFVVKMINTPGHVLSPGWPLCKRLSLTLIEVSQHAYPSYQAFSLPFIFYHVILATWCNWLDFYWCWINSVWVWVWDFICTLCQYHCPGALLVSILTSNKTWRTRNAVRSSNGDCEKTTQHFAMMSASYLFVGYMRSSMAI